MPKFTADVNVYYSQMVTIEVEANNEEDAIEGIKLGDYDDKIDEKLNGNDFRLDLGYCDEYNLNYIEEVV